MLSTDKTYARMLGRASTCCNPSTMCALSLLSCFLGIVTRPSSAPDIIESSVPEEETIHEVEQYGDDTAKPVLRKLDWRLIPLMFITYNSNVMDKTILSSASVFEFREDTVRHRSFHHHFLTFDLLLMLGST
jgi:hypothetical protein